MEYSLEQELEKWHIPGFQITVAKNGDILYSNSYGRKNLEQKEIVTKDTMFCIASCTKSFTVMIAAMLADEGLLNLDEPITTYMPEFALKNTYAGNHVCLRDIFLHRTGLAGHDFTWPDYEKTEKEYAGNIRFLDEIVPFRTVPRYNNVMYILAGYIEEIVSGKSWGNLVKEKILNPLCMTHTYVSLEEVPAVSDLSEGYKYEQDTFMKLESIAPKERASGSIVSTTEDMIKWLQLHLQKGMWNGKQLVSQKMMQEIHMPQVIFDEPVYDFEETCMPICYGLGWFIKEYRGIQIQYHHGGTLGFCSLQAYLPEQNISIAMLTNSHGCGGIFEDAIMNCVIDSLCGLPDKDWLEKYYSVWPGSNHEINLVPEDWESVCTERFTEDSAEELSGTYSHAGYPDIKIINQEKQVYLLFKMFSKKMQSISRDRYVVEGLIADTEFYRLPVWFERIEGRVCGLRIPLERDLQPMFFEKRRS